MSQTVTGTAQRGSLLSAEFTRWRWLTHRRNQGPVQVGGE